MGDLASGELDGLLGTITDWDLSQQAGLHVVEVYNHREKLGIPAFGRSQEREAARRQQTYWTPEMDTTLGKAPDWWVKWKLGLQGRSVRARRLWLGVPSWREKYQRIQLLAGDRVLSKTGRVRSTRRRNREVFLPDSLTQDQWKFALEFFEGRCAYCGQKAALTEDHLIPVSQEGGRVTLNILPACKSCNSSKHTMRAYLWIRSRFSPQRAQAIEAKIVEYLSLVKLKEQGY